MQELIDAKDIECKDLQKGILNFKNMLKGVREEFESIEEGGNEKSGAKAEIKKMIDSVSDGMVVKPQAVVKGTKLTT